MKKSILLSILALIAVFAALLVFSGDEEPPTKVAPPPQVTRAPEPAPVVEEAPAEDPALKEALLGLDKKQPEMAAMAVEPPKPARRRAVRRIEEDEPDEPAETGLSDYDFQATVGSWPGVKSCIATNAQRGEAKMSGAIQVAFTIHGDGNVIASKVVDASSEDARTLAPCVEKQARRIRFPAFAGNEETKTAKFVF